MGLGSKTAVIGISAVGGFACLYMTQAVYPELAQRYDVGAAGAGLSVTATTLGIAIAAPVAGSFSSRLGERASLGIGLSLLALLSGALALTTAWSWFLGLRLLQGLVIPMVLTSTLRLIEPVKNGTDSATHRWHRAIFVCGTILGGVLGRYYPAAMIGSIDWIGAFGTFALLLASMAALSTWKGNAFADVADSAPVAGASQQPAVWSHTFKNTCLTGFTLLFTQVSVFTYTAVRLAEAPFSLSASDIGIIYLVFLPSLLIVPLFNARTRVANDARTQRSAAICAGVGLALTMIDNLYAIALGLFLVASAVFVIQSILAGQVPKGGSGRFSPSGIYFLFYYGGASAGALLPGLMWNGHGWPACVALIVAVYCATKFYLSTDKYNSVLAEIGR